MSEDLLYEVRHNVAFLTINRENRRNAISQEMVAGFLEALERTRHDPDVRALCITGVGQKVFCSGADLAVTLAKEGEDPAAGQGARNYARLLKEMSHFPKPLVARVNGHCLAGGLGLMLSCDIVIARDDTFFSTPEVNVGIFPMMIGALILRDLPRKKAMDMVLTGRRVSAPEAEEMGLITRSVAPDRLDEAVDETLRLLTSRSPIAYQIGKEAFRAMDDMHFDEAVDALCEALGRVVATEDAREGMAAFMEKRDPRFKGK
jgi:enoyl-CoA hydratase/carnithine racemase